VPRVAPTTSRILYSPFSTVISSKLDAIHDSTALHGGARTQREGRQMVTNQAQPNDAIPGLTAEMRANYKQAVERALTHLPVKNGVINIDAVWIETSIPYEILHEILRLEDLQLPANVERINLKSNVRANESARTKRKRRRRRPKKKAKKE